MHCRCCIWEAFQQKLNKNIWTKSVTSFPTLSCFQTLTLHYPIVLLIILIFFNATLSRFILNYWYLKHESLQQTKSNLNSNFVLPILCLVTLLQTFCFRICKCSFFVTHIVASLSPTWTYFQTLSLHFQLYYSIIFIKVKMYHNFKILPTLNKPINNIHS